MANLTFEEVKEKLDNLGINLFDNEEWDCYDIYPQYTMRGLGSTEHTQDRSEESLKEAFKKGLQMAKKAGKFSKITFNRSESSTKRKKSNPDDTYSLWKNSFSRDSAKARKAALALKLHFAGKSKLSDFWPIIREERDLTVDEIKAKIESVIKKTSGARANPVRKLLRKNPQTLLGFFPFETTYSPDQIESLIIYADEINGLKEKGKFVAADKKLQKLENLCGKRLAEKVVSWRKYNKY